MTRAAPASDQLRLAENALAAGRFVEAAEMLRMVIRKDRDSPRPQLMLAYALVRCGQAPEALLGLRRLIERFPGNAEAWFNLGNILRSERQLNEAERAFRRAAQLQPGNPACHVNLVYALVQLGKFSEAESQVRNALTRFPQEPDLLANLGQILRATGRLEEAHEALEKCVALSPSHIGYRLTRAIVLDETGDRRGAETELRALLQEAPASAETHFYLAHLYLSQCRFAEGWDEYLWRPDRRRWLEAQGKGYEGPVVLEQRDYVLCGEQGLGDSLFFLRFAPPLRQIAKTTRLRIDPRLEAILPQDWREGAAVDDAVPVLVGDLPRLLRLGVVPPLRLTPEPARVAEFRQRVAQCGPAPYIGITWQGGFRWEDMPTPGERLFKRVAAAELGRTLSAVPGTLVSLQRATPKGDLEVISGAAGRIIHDLSAANDDLADALALLAALDDYVAVSNTNVHLNEALGKRTRVLVTHPAEWRWTAAGARSPWFPNAMLYRESRTGGWTEALARLQVDLK